MFCLPFEEAEKIKQAIKSGYLNPEKLNSMTSQERRAFFETIIGKENAKNVNLLFEKKLLLKNQERAMYDWAREITGLSKEEKEAILAKIRQTYEEKKRRIEDPAENEKFLNEIVSDIYSKKYKTEVTLEEAEMITNLTSEVRKAKAKMNEDFTWKTKEDGLRFGSAKVALNNYLGKLKAEAIAETFIDPRKVRGIYAKIEALSHNARIGIDFIASNSRAIVASLDNSLWGRQGIKVLFTHPKTWAIHFAKSFNDIWTVIKKGTEAGDAIIDGVRAEAFSRKNYLNGRYEMGKKLDIGIAEEEFPTSLPSKIPVFGRLFKASEVAYEAGAIRLRIDIADKIYDLAEQTGVDMKNKIEIGSINELVNSMTGRGRLGRLESAAPTLNKMFFSVKFLKSNIDTLTLHAFSEEFSSFARKQAAINLLKITASIGIILAIASSLGDDDTVEWDTRSSDFGKIRIGNTRFDITGGMSSIVILASRIIRQSTKSSTTGIITKFNEGYGSMTGMDALWQFTENKFSPLFSVIKELVEQETFEGEKPTLVTSLKNLTVPMVIETGMDAAEKESLANTLLALIADGLGISANTYSYNKNWEIAPGKELEQFRQVVGKDAFKEANKLYNEYVNKAIEKLKANEKYQKLSDEDKEQMLTKIKNEIKEEIFKKYKFKYVPTKK